MPTALVSRYESKGLSQQRHTATLNTMPPPVPMMRYDLKLWLSVQGLHSTSDLLPNLKGWGSFDRLNPDKIGMLYSCFGEICSQSGVLLSLHRRFMSRRVPPRREQGRYYNSILVFCSISIVYHILQKEANKITGVGLKSKDLGMLLVSRQIT